MTARPGEMIPAWALIVLLTAVGLWQIFPPAALPEDAPPDEFSAERAMRHVEAIAQEPHPSGSQENARVRRYLVDALTHLGLTPRVEEHHILTGSEADQPLALHNIVARLPGTEGRRAVMLAAHYDSVPASPGAADDGAAVAAILETLRALHHGPPLKNDLIVLITDGEEMGMLGAQAFVRSDPWVRDIDVVLNFEARGTGGPSMLFETSEGNGWLMRQFAAAAPAPLATSVAYDIYRLLPNDTDFTIFRQAGLEGLNFAFFGGPARYHTPQDTPENLDPRALQHHGTYALSLSRRFGQLDLNAASQPHGNSVYFNPVRPILIVHPQSWLTPLLIALTLLLATGLWLGFKRQLLTGLGLLQGCGFTLACPLMIALIAMLLLAILPFSYPETQQTALPVPHDRQSSFYLVGLVLLAIALQLAALMMVRGRVGVANLHMGTMIGFLILAILTTWGLPGGAYLFMWPLVGGVVGFATIFPPRRTARGSALRWIGLTISAAAAVLLLAPMVPLAAVALTITRAWAALLVLSLLLLILTPHLDIMMARKGWVLPIIAAVGAVGMLAMGMVMNL